MCEWGKNHKPGYPFGYLKLKGLRILVIEDEVDTCDHLRTMLEECEAQVTAVASANEALEMLNQVPPDALVIDAGMLSNSGYPLIRLVRALETEKQRQIPVVALTASASERQQSLREGCQVHISKPVELAELVATIGMLTGKA
ncbi:MAG: response regulator [Coleofasciculus sp. S288]|nr:response regulator [Coleofasciculus sp. S288]